MLNCLSKNVIITSNKNLHDHIIYNTKLDTCKRRNVNETEMKPGENNGNEIKCSVIKPYCINHLTILVECCINCFRFFFSLSNPTYFLMIMISYAFQSFLNAWGKLHVGLFVKTVTKFWIWTTRKHLFWFDFCTLKNLFDRF